MRRRSQSLGGLAVVLLTWCVLASSLALVTAAPVQAANTAAELLVDPADRTKPATHNGVREFAGADRYQTALRIAERYARERGGLDSVPTVIVASGETLVDAAVSARLAARHGAPILLTPSTRLYGAVADYLRDHQVSSVIVVGGPASVSDEVLDELAALQPAPTVRRIFGQDRFATAAAIAADFADAAHWCGSDDTAALLANAGDERLGELVATGPLAAALEVPVLLTQRTTVPHATLAALRSLDIKRVVIVGTAAVVSEDVIGQVLAAGVDATERIPADSPETMSAAVATLMTTSCDAELDTAQYLVALAGAGSAVDAAAAAPLLALGLDGSGPVPLLFVGTRLHSSASRFLSATKNTVDNRKTHVDLIAIGGTAAITEATVQLASRTATTSRPLISRIRGAAGENFFTVDFTEALLTERAQFEERMRDVLYVNGAPAWIVEQELMSTQEADACDAVSSLTVTLARPLQAGDLIEMHDVEGWFATNDDRRPLWGTRFRVQEPRTATSPPKTEFIALEGRSEIVVAVEYDPAASDGSGSTIDPSRIRILANRDVLVDVGTPDFAGAERLLRLAFYRLPLTAPDGYAGDSGSEPIAPGGAYELAFDDIVDVRGGAVSHAGDLRSGRSRTRARPPAAGLDVSAVHVGPANPGVDDRAATTTPDAIAEVSERAQVTFGESVRIVGKWAGSAAGAAGNGWLIDSARASARLAETASAISQTDHPAIRVWIDTRDRVILLRYIDGDDGEPPELTYGDFVRALNSNSVFARHFLAELLNGCIDESQPLPLPDDSDLIGESSLADGLSSVSLLVQFNDYVAAFVDDGEPDVADVGNAGAVVELIDDVLGALIEDYGEPSDPPPPTPDRVETTTLLPNNQVLFRFTTADPDHTIGQLVDFRRSRIEIAAGIARGHAPDDPETTDVDESLNATKTLLAASNRASLLSNNLPAPAL